MGSAVAWDTGCCTGRGWPVGRCLAWADRGRSIDDGIDDLAPAFTAFRTVAVMRSVNQWNDADGGEFEADGVIQRRVRILVRGGGLEPPRP